MPKPKRICLKASVFIIITGLSVLFCGCSLVGSPIEYPDYNRWYIKEHNNYSDAEWQEVLKTRDDLSKLGITLPERFLTLQDAKIIVDQRKKLENNLVDKGISPDKPVTVTMFPLYDYGGRIFSARQNGLTTLINHPKQQVIYFEISNDKALKDALTLLINNLLPDVKEIVLILAGHGDINWLFWNTGSLDNKLDPSDYQNTEFMKLFHDLPIKLAIFDSCSSGRGGQPDSPNQVNRLAQHIQAGGSVIGPQFDVGGMVCTFDPQNNNITDVKYTTDLASGSLVYADAAYYAPGQYKP